MKNILYYKYILFLLSILAIFPGARIFGFTVSREYLLLPLIFLLVLYKVMIMKKMPKEFWTSVGLWIFVICSVIISLLSGPISYNYDFNISLDIISYVGKFIIFIFAYLLVYSYKEIMAKAIIKIIVYVLIIAMLIGLWQWLPLPYSDELLLAYARDSENIMSQVERGMISRRVPGVAHMATAHGALAAFSAILAYSLSLVIGWRKEFFLLYILSLISLFPSLSRLGMFAFVLMTLLMPFITIKSKHLRSKSIKYGLIIFTKLILLLTVSWKYISDALIRIIRRWDLLFVQLEQGENRLSQIYNVINIQEGTLSWLFGASRAGQNYLQEAELFGHIEVEFLNILFLYGIFGLVFHYLFVVWIFFILIKGIKHRNSTYLLAIIVASLSGLVTYQFISIGYFFFREVHVGYFVWLMLGAGLGAVSVVSKKNTITYIPIKQLDDKKI